MSGKWAVLLLLAGCASQTLSPADCRSVGVNVPDGATITGRIVAENITDAATVQARCQSPFEPQAGCAIAVAPGEYVIWSIDDPAVILHERCHALYEVGHG